MNRIFLFSLVLLIATLYSCKPKADFKIHKSGLIYKYLYKSNDSVSAQLGEFMILRVKYTTENDSVLFSTDDLNKPLMLKLDEPSHKGGSIEDGLSIMHIGDSMRFWVDAKSFFEKTRRVPLPDGVKPKSKIIFDVKFQGIVPHAEVEKENVKKKTQEEVLLDDFIRTNNIKIKSLPDGLYIIPLKKGAGEKPKKGKMVAIHYQAYLLNGRKFDSTVDRHEPFEFEIGKGDVIAGLEEAVLTMKIGERIKIIIPSSLAYADKGYGKTIPPFSTLIFEVQLLDVFDKLTN